MVTVGEMRERPENEFAMHGVLRFAEDAGSMDSALLTIPPRFLTSDRENRAMRHQ